MNNVPISLPKLDTYTFVKNVIPSLSIESYGIILVQLEEMMKVEGFGEVIKDSVVGELGEHVVTYFLDKRQLLIFSALFSDSVRYKCIQRLYALYANPDEILSELLRTSVKQLEIRYREDRDMVDAYQSIINLVRPSIDVEFYPITHFVLCRLYSSLKGRRFTTHEVKKLMVERGLLDKDTYAPLNPNIKEITHSIELGDGRYVTTRSLVYTHHVADLVISRIS